MSARIKWVAGEPVPAFEPDEYGQCREPGCEAIITEADLPLEVKGGNASECPACETCTGFTRKQRHGGLADRWSPEALADGYVAIPNRLLRQAAELGLDAIDVAVIAYLETHRRGDATEAVWPATAVVAQALGLSRNTVLRRLAKLVKAGLLERDEGGRSVAGTQRPNRYRRAGLTAALSALTGTHSGYRPVPTEVPAGTHRGAGSRSSKEEPTEEEAVDYVNGVGAAAPTAGRGTNDASGQEEQPITGTPSDGPSTSSSRKQDNNGNDGDEKAEGRPWDRAWDNCDPGVAERWNRLAVRAAARRSFAEAPRAALDDTEEAA